MISETSPFERGLRATGRSLERIAPLAGQGAVTLGACTLAILAVATFAWGGSAPTADDGPLARRSSAARIGVAVAANGPSFFIVGSYDERWLLLNSIAEEARVRRLLREPPRVTWVGVATNDEDARQLRSTLADQDNSPEIPYAAAPTVIDLRPTAGVR